MKTYVKLITGEVPSYFESDMFYEICTVNGEPASITDGSGEAHPLEALVDLGFVDYAQLKLPSGGYYAFDGRWRCNKTMCHRKDCLDCYPIDGKSISVSITDFVGVYAPPVTEKEIEKEQGISRDSQARKDSPVFSGFCAYFPHAMFEVARLSKIGNDKHNPGEPLHWSKGKSNDHGDCIIRHQLEYDKVDQDTGLLHAVSVAWRAMAQLETLLTDRD